MCIRKVHKVLPYTGAKYLQRFARKSTSEGKSSTSKLHYLLHNTKVIKLLLCLGTMPKNQGMYQSVPTVLHKDRSELDDTLSFMMYQQHTHSHIL